MKILTKLLSTGKDGQVLTKVGDDNFAWHDTSDIHRIHLGSNDIVSFCRMYHNCFDSPYSFYYGIGYNFRILAINKPNGITGDYAFNSTLGFNLSYAEDSTTYVITFMSTANVTNMIEYRFNKSDDSFVSEIMVYTGGTHTTTAEAEVNALISADIYYTTSVISF